MDNDKNYELTERQRKFCRLYLTYEGNIRKAAIDAGYSEKTATTQGSRLLKNVVIKEHIEKLRSELIISTMITPEYVFCKLHEMALKCMEPQLLYTDKEGHKHYKMADSIAAVKAFESMFRIIGAFSNKGRRTSLINIEVR